MRDWGHSSAPVSSLRGKYKRLPEQPLQETRVPDCSKARKADNLTQQLQEKPSLRLVWDSAIENGKNTVFSMWVKIIGKKTS